MKFLLVALCAGILFGCKKSSAGLDNTPVFTTYVRAQTDDLVRISTTIDAIFNDVDSVLANPVDLCSAHVSVDSVSDTVSILYNNGSCGSLSYSGTVRIGYVPGSNFDHALDTVGIRLYNVMVNTPPDTAHISFSGLVYYTNVSGGSLAGLAGGGASPVVHTITGVNLNVVYAFTWPSNWQIARQRTYSNDGGLVISTSGMDSVGTFGAVSEWGGNRFGNSVIAGIDSALTIHQGCGWQLTGGRLHLYNPAGTTSVTYGLDSTGAATGCPAAGIPYYYKLSWTGIDENPYTAVLPYP
ncbi:MAG TPA: hypothetical protein VHE54_15075 [Puia sp.]|nr:hypothetical protein [Puia sp.]